MMTYNAVNVALSVYIAAGIAAAKLRSAGSVAALARDGLVCTPLDVGPEGQRMARLFVVFFLQKFLEYGDTLFFVLRRSFRQVRRISHLQREQRHARQHW
jgi:GNS1/SUR4 family